MLDTIPLALSASMARQPTETQRKETFAVARRDLLDVPCYVLSPDSPDLRFVHRRNSVMSGLQARGFRRIEVVRGLYTPADPVYGCAFGHGIVIEKALSRPFEPFLVLEDDALLEPMTDTSLTVPSDADALYLGITHVGAALAGNAFIHIVNGNFFSPTPEPGISRLYNMLSTHAVLVLTEAFARNWQRCAVESCVREACPVDVLLGLTHRYYNVYGYNQPLFYQAQHLGGHEQVTRIALRGIEIASAQELPAHRLTSREPGSVAVDIAAHRQRQGSRG